MKGLLVNLAQTLAFVLCLLSPLQGRADPFVELTAEIEGNSWDYWFLSDSRGRYGFETRAPSIFSTNQIVRCVVGASTWMIETEGPRARVTRWFTGTNIIEHTVILKETPDADIKRASEALKLAMTSPPVGHRSTRVYESVDGNPGRPARVLDLMLDFPARVGWLAFCSGPSLRSEGRRIFPPSGEWKESVIVSSGWSDRTEVYRDGLGLPKSINLVTTNNQSLFRYQVRQSTNVLGWTFPLEFYGVQCQPEGADARAWTLHLTLKGRVTAIGAGTEPRIPPEVMKFVGH